MSFKKAHDDFINSQNASERYDREITKYNNLFFLEKLATDKPVKPSNYNDYRYHYSTKHSFDFYMPNFLKIYGKIAKVCELKGEEYPARVCKAVLKDIEAGTSRGNEVLKKQANKIQYIGDLYNEIKPN